MDFLNNFLVKVFGYDSAIIIKNLIILAAALTASQCASAISGAFLSSITRVDKKGILESEGLAMLILEKKGNRFFSRTRILIPPNISMFEHLLNRIIIFLFKIHVIKDGRINHKDVRKAKVVFAAVAIFAVIIIGLALGLSISALPYPVPR